MCLDGKLITISRDNVLLICGQLYLVYLSLWSIRIVTVSVLDIGSPIISGSISIHSNVWLGLMYNVKRIGVWKYEPEEQGVGPFTWGAQSEHLTPPHLPETPIEGSVYHQPGSEVDIPVTARRVQVSKRGIEKGARGITKGKKRARGLRRVYCNLYMCT